MDHATKVYQIYDKTVKRCFSLSNKSTINLINGLYERDYPLDSQVLYNWTEHTDDDLKRTLADTIITITTPESSQSYHVEIQMDEDRSIVLRIFEYGVTVQDGGKMDAKACVKLAYKLVFASIFTSDGHPMLLVRQSRARRCPVLNSYNTVSVTR